MNKFHLIENLMTFCLINVLSRNQDYFEDKLDEKDISTQNESMLELLVEKNLITIPPEHYNDVIENGKVEYCIVTDKGDKVLKQIFKILE